MERSSSTSGKLYHKKCKSLHNGEENNILNFKIYQFFHMFVLISLSISRNASVSKRSFGIHIIPLQKCSYYIPNKQYIDDYY